MTMPLGMAAFSVEAITGSLVVLAGAALALPGVRRWLGRVSLAGPSCGAEAGVDAVSAGVLEAIIADAIRLNATRQLPELVDGTLAAFASASGFGRLALYLWSEAGSGFELHGASGHDARSCAALGRRLIGRAEGQAAGCPCGDDVDAVVLGGPGLPGDAWSEGTVLRMPLRAATGDLIGFLDLEEPRGGCLPSRDILRGLTFLARQSAAAIESVQLTDRLAANNAELARASAMLQTLADMKANFVANVSHELRTPLTSISAYTELLQQNLASMSPEALGEFLKVIHAESGKLTGVINDILELNQMESGRTIVRRTHMDLGDLVRRLQDGWAGRAAAAGLTLVVDLPAAPLELPVDPVLMQQLLTHLVGNAFKFTPVGGRVTVALEESGSAVRLCVRDTGIGIPADKLGAVFDKFYQVDGSATRAHNGQGVGLAICHQIVVHHDGRIWAENMPGGGACLTVLLPRRAPVVKSIAASQSPAQPFDESEFLTRLMHWLAESMGVQTVSLMAPLADGQHLGIRAAIGLSEAVVQGTRLGRGMGIAGQVWVTGRTIRVDDLTRDSRFARPVNEPRFSTPSVLCVPLPGPHGVAGVVTVNNRLDGRPLDDDDRLFLEALAPQLAGMLARHEAWRNASREMARLRDSLRATTAVGHLRHECLPELCHEIGLATARRAELTPDECRHLALALQFYDVGMSVVPPQLLHKPEPLAPHEQRIVQGHVEAGLEILEPLRPAAEARRIILHHHENIDGSGYPSGLAGDAIPPAARVLRLTDTLAALLSPRPWRPALDLDEALGSIEAAVGAAYCPWLTPLFLHEARQRRERIAQLQHCAGDAQDLARPLLDRRGMATVS